MGFVERAVRGQETVDHLDDPTPPARSPGGLIEGLQLDQQLVDYAGDPLPAAAGPHPGPAGTDGVDLLDEPDSTALLAGRLAQLGEKRADLAVGLPVEHRLERRGGHEEERHAGLARQRLGQMRLTGPRWSLEEDALPGCPAHLGTEGGVGQKQVQGTDRLLHHDGDPFYIVQRDVDLLGPVPDMGRAAGRHQRHHHDRRHQQQDADKGQGLGLGVRQARGADQMADQH